MSSINKCLLDTCKRELLEIYKFAIESVKPNSLINESVVFENNNLVIKTKDNLTFNIEKSNLHIYGVGKCALNTAEAIAKAHFSGLTKAGVQSQFNNKQLFSHGCMSVPYSLKEAYEQNKETQSLLQSIDTKVYFGSKDNLPSKEAVNATTKILQSISDACNFDRTHNRRPLFVILLSGGGSACLTKPKYICLKEKMRIIQHMVENGANIIELNKVRSYFSHVKGGELAKFIIKNHPDAQIVSLILSDVIGDSTEFIASGPTVLQSSIVKKQQMLDILAKYSYPIETKQLQCDDDNDDERSMICESNITNRIIGNNLVALKALTEKAKSLGYTVISVGNTLEGKTEQVVLKMIDFGDKRLSMENCNKLLIIGGGEATVSKKSGETWGKGGRLQEMAMDYMISKTIHRSNGDQCLDYIDIFLAGSSDGQDGPTDVAATFASYYEWDKQDVKAFNLEKLKLAKSSHDSYNFWTTNKPEWLIKTGLTGTNVMDLYMYSIIKC